MALPGRLGGKRRRARLQGRDRGRGQPLTLPVGQRHLVDRVAALLAVQDLQKVQSALVRAALEVGKQIVADRRTGAGLSAVAGGGIIDPEVRRRLQSRH